MARVAPSILPYLKCRKRSKTVIHIHKDGKPIHILLVEDSKGDIMLTQRAFKNAKITNTMDVVRDGISAMQYLRKEGDFKEATRPDLILMDLNIPGKDGLEALTEIKSDKKLRAIPVIVLSSSEADSDVSASYNNFASGYIVKPLDGKKFIEVAESIEGFWFSTAKLPRRKS
ncbi:MAG: response regulator [Alphaproteobacteria bacterium]|nr:response regulator [Alphaproteobacteria bacterium]